MKALSPHAEGVTGKQIIHTLAFNSKSGGTKLLYADYKTAPDTPPPILFLISTLLAIQILP